MLETDVDDRQGRVRQQPLEYERGSRKETAADDRHAVHGRDLPQQDPERTLVRRHHEPLQPRQPQHDTFERLKTEGVQPAQHRRPAADMRT